MNDPVNWHVSSYSGTGQSCVEMGYTDRTVYVRDSKDAGAGTIRVEPGTWNSFLASAKSAHVQQLPAKSVAAEMPGGH